MGSAEATSLWPALPYEAWKDTYATFHMMTQVIGKIRLKLATPVNHWWHVTLYVTARGLTTSAIPYQGRAFQIDFDFLRHELLIQRDSGETRSIALRPRTVAEFYREVMSALREMGIDVHIWTKPAEVQDAIPFDRDTTHHDYDADAVARCWRAMEQSARVFAKFRSQFIGKCSPVHFFWGSFDLAVTRFSGRKAPPHAGSAILPQSVTLEAYSHEVSSAGFWPGGATLPEPLYYAYAYPEPPGYRAARVAPLGATYNAEFGEFVLPYDTVRTSEDPDRMLLDFLQTTYDAEADLAKWDRAALERASDFPR
jgi:hypothetical protein